MYILCCSMCIWKGVHTAMKIILYGFNQKQVLEIVNRFGDHDYQLVEVYQDIIAHSADLVIVNVNCVNPDELKIIKEYENETKGCEDREYIYIDLEKEGAPWSLA